MSLLQDSKGLSATFKKNLGTILARIQKQHELEVAQADSSAVDSQAHVEALLGDVDRIISDQKQLSDLIQNGKHYIPLSCLVLPCSLYNSLTIPSLSPSLSHTHLSPMPSFN
jgi:hypothetical protein